MTSARTREWLGMLLGWVGFLLVFIMFGVFFVYTASTAPYAALKVIFYLMAVFVLFPIWAIAWEFIPSALESYRKGD